MKINDPVKLRKVMAEMIRKYPHYDVWGAARKSARDLGYGHWRWIRTVSRSDAEQIKTTLGAALYLLAIREMFGKPV